MKDAANNQMLSMMHIVMKVRLHGLYY